MTPKRFVTIDELCKLKNLRRWRVYDMTRKGLIPVKHVCGKPILPYQIDLTEFERLETTSMPIKRQRSFSIKQQHVHVGHKEKLWQE